jgi:hypothetical protein
VSQPPPSDFSLGTTGTSSQSIAAGGTATFSFSLAPTGGTYPGAVSFHRDRLAHGSDGDLLSFEHRSQRRSADGDADVKDIGTGRVEPANLPSRRLDRLRSAVSAAGGHRRMRRVSQKLSGRASLALLLLLSLGAMAGLSGCNGSPVPFHPAAELHHYGDGDQRLRATHHQQVK